jgi:hypothetical protein
MLDVRMKPPEKGDGYVIFVDNNFLHTQKYCSVYIIMMMLTDLNNNALNIWSMFVSM